jgi:hypothetical protein
MSEDMKERVDKFNRLELPGQPIMMHMGTSYLVNDLWREVERLRERVHAMNHPSETLST